MKPAVASVILHKLKQLDTKLTALTPEEWTGTGLKPHRLLKEESTGQPIFIYVDRLELIECIRASSNIHLKGTNICHLSNFKTNPEGTQ